jgi:ubiquinone/menaquinone biosynthesis C-methylase UbiE
MGYPQTHFVFAWEDCREMKAEIFEYLRDCKKILDVGYGDGKVITDFKKTYPKKEFTGVDIRKSKCVNGFDSYRVVGSAEMLPLPNGYFDGAVGSFFLEYIDDKERAVKGIGSVLRPKGKAVFFMHHPENNIVDELEQTLSDNPSNADARYYLERLQNNMFKSEKECIKFFDKLGDVEFSGVWEGSSPTSPKRKMCYEILISNIEKL